MGYSQERKAAVLKRMLPPNNMAIRQLSKKEGISEGTLHRWRSQARSKGQFLPIANAGPKGWSSADKFATVLETAALNEADLSEYCRKRGVYPGVCQASCPHVSCGVSNFRDADFGFWIQPDGPNGLPVPEFS